MPEASRFFLSLTQPTILSILLYLTLSTVVALPAFAWEPLSVIERAGSTGEDPDEDEPDPDPLLPVSEPLSGALACSSSMVAPKTSSYCIDLILCGGAIGQPIAILQEVYYILILCSSDDEAVALVLPVEETE